MCVKVGFTYNSQLYFVFYNKYMLNLTYNPSETPGVRGVFLRYEQAGLELEHGDAFGRSSHLKAQKKSKSTWYIMKNQCHVY
jgi:hypothetical protein